MRFLPLPESRHDNPGFAKTCGKPSTQPVVPDVSKYSSRAKINILHHTVGRATVSDTNTGIDPNALFFRKGIVDMDQAAFRSLNMVLRKAIRNRSEV